jgi:hypothetical protein
LIINVAIYAAVPINSSYRGKVIGIGLVETGSRIEIEYGV